MTMCVHEDLDESVIHVIFECPPDLQAWAVAATPTHPNIFPMSIIYTNMDYFFLSKSSIKDQKMERDPYPWIIWYFRKARNYKLFRGIDRNPMDLIRYAAGECQA